MNILINLFIAVDYACVHLEIIGIRNIKTSIILYKVRKYGTLMYIML